MTILKNVKSFLYRLMWNISGPIILLCLLGIMYYGMLLANF